MPEGPDLYMASRFINRVCKSRHFSGNVKKSQVSKCPPVRWSSKLYKISATSRGKEIKLTLADVQGTKKKTECNSTKQGKCLDIVFTFGLTGKFSFDPVDQLPKHAHLSFFTEDKKMVLSYVDTMRYGKWTPKADWRRDRGPCVLLEYDEFRENILSNVTCAAFHKPICEALLNQKYFNGIGNYLRAEILYRAGIRPFEEARKVLEPLSPGGDVKPETPDILYLCHSIVLEVVKIRQAEENDQRSGYDEDYATFTKWLRCYNKQGMNNMSDHNGRTIWFAGDPGPMMPKDAKEKLKKSGKQSPERSSPDISSSMITDQSNIKRRTRSGVRKSHHQKKLHDEELVDTKDITMLRSKLMDGQKREHTAKKTRSRKRRKMAS